MPESRDDFERAWAEIVQDLTSGGRDTSAAESPAIDDPGSDVPGSDVGALLDPAPRGPASHEPASDEPEPGLPPLGPEPAATDAEWAEADRAGGPAATGANDDRTEGDQPARADARDGAEAAEPHDPARGGSGSASGLEALFQPLRRQRSRPDPDPAPDEFVDSWEDEGHYVPPPPPEIPEGTPVERLAWAGVIGGPLVILLITVTGWSPPAFVGLGAGLATLAGFVTLVWHLPEGRPDGWDDGARL